MGIEPTSPAWKAGAFDARPRARVTPRRKGRESNPQGCEARPGSSGVPSPVGLYFRKAAAAGIEPASGRLTATYPDQHGTHRITSVRTAGFEPAISCSRGTRNTRLSYVLNLRAPSGSRTRTSAMARRQAAATSWALAWKPGCQRSREHREGLEPSSPHYESGVFAARSPVLVFQVGPEGLEPSPARLRAGDAAANTSVPSIESARWESNPRPASYKDAALTTELRASGSSRAGGI